MKKFLGLAVLLLLPAAAHAQAPYYQGKTITFIVGSARNGYHYPVCSAITSAIYSRNHGVLIKTSAAGG